MRVTILHKAIILTKTCRVTVSMMSKGCIVARILPLRCFLFLVLKLYQYLSVIFLVALVCDEPEVLLPKYSQRAILHAAYFWRGVIYKYI